MSKCGGSAHPSRKPNGEWDGYGPSPPVYVAAAVDVHDLHRAGVFGDAVDHAVVTSPSRVEADQFGTEGFAYPSWIVGKGPEDELDASRGDLLRQLLQIPFRSSRDSDRVRSAHSGDPVAGLEFVVVSESAGVGVGHALANGFGNPRSA